MLNLFYDDRKGGGYEYDITVYITIRSLHALDKAKIWYTILGAKNRGGGNSVSELAF